MDTKTAIEWLNQLRNGEIRELRIKKEDFLTFRAVLVQQEDFKHFRGVAQRGGDVIYHYMKQPRS
jgi:hypothetical protein